ncbi:hypothetical protein [Frankia sp. R43]|uniref:cupin domain-containing protein n=1 Tax=Frankia sp. R43 TaxID=269536 RepID=UPI0006CA0452|nr:hypothetical protein [Frankia sp. R43]
MTTNDPTADDVDDALAPDGSRRMFKSERGPFQVFTAPAILAPPQPEEITDEMVEGFLNFFDYSDLVNKGEPEVEVREAVKQMSRASMPGMTSVPLFDQGGPKGMSLVWVWFGPNYKLFRHGHPPLGDCLYLVVAGSLHLGHRELGPGDGFFVPHGMLYRYRAGSQGVQVLEIRAGTEEPLGTPGSFRMGEPSVKAIRKLTEDLIEHQSEWKHWPSRIGEDSSADW